MAKLEIELSEYDAMREARKTAEARVEELKQENKELRNSSKVILRRETKYMITQVDKMELAEIIKLYLEREFFSNIDIGQRFPIIYEHLTPEALAEICIKAWKRTPKTNHPISTIDTNFPTKSDTLIGFEDIRLQVENMFKEQFEEEHKKALEKLQSEIDSCKKERIELSEKLTKEFEATYKSKISSLEKESNKLKEENIKLSEKLKEASKSHEEKLAEAERKVQEAQEELIKLQGKKKHWWQK